MDTQPLDLASQPSAIVLVLGKLHLTMEFSRDLPPCDCCPETEALLLHWGKLNVTLHVPVSPP